MKRYLLASLAAGFVAALAVPQAAQARFQMPETRVKPPTPPDCKIQPWKCTTGPTFPIPPKKPGPVYKR